MSCANTSLPWFIEPPRAMLPGRAAKPKFEIQIETKKINRLCVFHQQLTGAENPNVGTLLIVPIPSASCICVAMYREFAALAIVDRKNGAPAEIPTPSLLTLRPIPRLDLVLPQHPRPRDVHVVPGGRQFRLLGCQKIDAPKLHGI